TATTRADHGPSAGGASALTPALVENALMAGGPPSPIAGAKLVAERPERRVLIGLRGVVRDPSEIDLGHHGARGGLHVLFPAKREDPELAGLERPHLANAEPLIDGELVERAARDDHLQRDVRDLAVHSAAVTLVRLEPAPLLFLPERGGAV